MNVVKEGLYPNIFHFKEPWNMKGFITLSEESTVQYPAPHPLTYKRLRHKDIWLASLNFCADCLKYCYGSSHYLDDVYIYFSGKHILTIYVFVPQLHGIKLLG